MIDKVFLEEQKKDCIILAHNYQVPEIQEAADFVGDSLELLKRIPSESIDLALTSPPFALQRQKEYGNLNQDEYVDWLMAFTVEVKRVLRETGSFVLDLGGFTPLLYAFDDREHILDLLESVTGARLTFCYFRIPFPKL